MDVPLVSREELKILIERGGEYTLIDIRETDELQHGMIPTALHLPLSKLKDSLALSPTAFFAEYGFVLPKDERIIMYCRSGSRSYRASAYLRSLGYDAVNFKGSVLAWSEIDPNVKAY